MLSSESACCALLPDQWLNGRYCSKFVAQCAAVGSRSRQFTRKGCGGILQTLKLPLLKDSLSCAGGNRNKPQRPDYKFNKKPKRAKARSSGNDGGGYDGAAFTTGKRGGLVRPLGQ